jgi:hypothetical protein
VLTGQAEHRYPKVSARMIRLPESMAEDFTAHFAPRR